MECEELGRSFASLYSEMGCKASFIGSLDDISYAKDVQMWIDLKNCQQYKLMFGLGYILGSQHIFDVENALVVDLHIHGRAESLSTFKIVVISSGKQGRQS